MRKIFYALSVTFLLLQSCSSGDSPDSPTPSVGTLIKKIVSSDGSIYNYSYNGNKLSKITYVGDKYQDDVKFTYTGDLITKIEHISPFYSSDPAYDPAVEEDSFTGISVFSYENNNIKQQKWYYSSGDLAWVKDYTYNNDGTIAVNITDNGVTTLKYVYKEYYNSAGNIYKTTKNYGGGEIKVYNFEYDTKNSPFKNIIGISNLFRFSDGPLMFSDYSLMIYPVLGSLNNLKDTSSSNYSSDNIITSYQYNNQGLPISATINEGVKIKTFTYYY